MRIVICNERLLPRFGVDRVLLIIGRRLVTLGHDVAFVCIRADRETISRFSQNVRTISVPSELSILQTEAFAAEWLRAQWKDLLTSGDPELILTGGWPFFCVAEIAREKSVPSAFIDAGAVPHHGLPAEMLRAQQDLRRVRFLMMPLFTAIFPISGFIRESQTIVERGHDRGVNTVLLGADHLERPLFHSAHQELSVQSALARVEKALTAGCRLVLALGRFEAVGYKNSPAIFEVFSQIISQWPSAKLLLLARQGEMLIPDHLQSAVISLGFIDDQTLHNLMQHCEIGISTSLWEGFNLPMAEMQWCGRPVLAFAVGAHPELVLDPWYLCASIEEIASKAIRLLASNALDGPLFQKRVEAFRRAFTWKNSLETYVQLIEELVKHPIDAAVIPLARFRRMILVDCTNTAGNLEEPGVARVTRRLTAYLQEVGIHILIFARWSTSKRTYVVLDGDASDNLSGCDGPKDHAFFVCNAGEAVSGILSAVVTDEKPILLIPEVVLDGQCPERIVWARARGFSIATILYDLIPITHPPLCSPDIVARFPEYLISLAACDGLWAISQASLTQFDLFTTRHNLAPPREQRAICLPGQFGTYCRVHPSGVSIGSPAVALCIASIERRKNHWTLLEGFRRLMVTDVGIDLRLILVGQKAPGADDLASWIEARVKEEDALTWTGYLPDNEVADLFETALFTVCPSMSDGYGLPVLESLWMGRPSLCHNAGVTATLAVDGGCLTVDMSNPDEIAAGLQRMVRDESLHRTLVEQIAQRGIPSWEDYGRAIYTRLESI